MGQTAHRGWLSASILLVAVSSTALLGGCAAATAAAPTAEPNREEPTAAATVTVPAERPPATVEPPGEPVPAGSTAPARRVPPGPATGIPECDAYLAMYESCEPRLHGDIQAGNRRAPDAERAWLLYIAGTPERAALPAGCRDMLAMIRDLCP